MRHKCYKFISERKDSAEIGTKAFLNQIIYISLPKKVIIFKQLQRFITYWIFLSEWTNCFMLHRQKLSPGDGGETPGFAYLNTPDLIRSSSISQSAGLFMRQDPLKSGTLLIFSNKHCSLNILRRDPDQEASPGIA
ncbi:hypothetical protein TNCV_4840251 [Trichonephila clavipes]|nr:hypothetical protein TNCV_4840251 [Trichonephila clavipes]